MCIVNRVEFLLNDDDLKRLDKIAKRVGVKLLPHHAAVAGHEFSRKAAFLMLLEEHDKYQEKR